MYCLCKFKEPIEWEKDGCPELRGPILWSQCMPACTKNQSNRGHAPNKDDQSYGIVMVDISAANTPSLTTSRALLHLQLKE